MLCNFALAALSQFAVQVDPAVLPALEGKKPHQLLKVIFYRKDAGPIQEHVTCQISSSPLS